MRALVLMFLCGTASAAPWTGILAPERAIDWTQVGIPGGIPVRNTQCGSTLTAGSSTSTVQAAIDAANPATCNYILFGAGTFNIAPIYVRKAITLRGSGPNSTYLNISGSNGIQLGQDISWSVSGTPVSWTGGLTRGSTQLTVSSTTGMVAGQTIIIDELNPSWVHIRGYNNTACGQTGAYNTCGRNGQSIWFGDGNNPTNGLRAAGQMTKIVSVDNSTHITIKDPVAYTHTAGLTPQVFTWTYSGQNGNFEGAGVENMKVFSNGNPYTIDIAFCDYCYVKNVWITQNARSAVRAYWSYGFVIRDSYIDSTNVGAPTQYGFEILSSSFGLVENNIAYTVTSAMMPQSNFGVVFGYNYVLNNSANIAGGNGNQFAAFAPHLAHQFFELWEGNVGSTIDYDMIWGSGSHSTMFRNRFHGRDPNKTQYTRAFELSAYNRYMNAVGNVLGDSSYATTYLCTLDVGNGHAGDGAIYDLGQWHGCPGGEEPNQSYGSYDSVTVSSLVRWGNWDAVTYNASGGTHKGTRWCTGSGTGASGSDAYNSACTADERGSDADFPPLSNPSTTFPASLYNGTTGAHASCGTMLSFWKNPSSGYCPPYPPIGPDVTCASNCNANAASHANKIPAQLCYEASAKDSDGYLTAFDAADCYSADTGAKPNKPTGVH